METLSANRYRRRALAMMENSDFVSQKLFDELAVQETEHSKVFYSKTRRLNDLSAIAPNIAPSHFLRKQILEKEYCL
jgi:bacterioferritin (cytochrome b1)